MYCHECGTANTVDSKYCKECGTKINDGYRTMMLSVLDLPVDQSEETLDQLTRLLDMAFWHNEAGNQDAAITAAEAALSINPSSTTAHSLLGTLYEKRGDDAEAIAHFEAVLALNPDSPADAAKLDQLRRGVHVKAAASPVSHVWLPPGLVRLAPTLKQKWTTLSASDQKTAGLQRRPLLAAGAAAGLVLFSGLLLLRPWARADTGETQTHTMVASAPSTVAANHSAFAGGETTPISPPMVLTPGTSSGFSSYISPPPAPTGPDPFAGVVPSTTARTSVMAGASPVWSLPTVPRLTAAARRRLARRELPSLPLRLTALPSSGDLAPAPVTLPDGMPMATVASIPRHTVVVNSLGQDSPGRQDTGVTPGSHIRITVRQATSADTDRVASAVGEGGADESLQANVYQQRALSLQQGGDYGKARAAYARAIRAYQGQITTGRDIDTAQRGLAACQTGIQICQQSQ